ncbi:hypothetical protein AAFF_G00133840 [Aldrovandia affinis]|uniref:Uncharacterized protein n=1 Tax=Aldrovandia affinis TaxID=143900 RepID=A0AAD7RQ35_9TELE|nr:hypothetical protein AAFF_G00133840 [Aldrovandia affinis]
MLSSNTGGALSLDGIANMQGGAYSFTPSGDWPQDAFSLVLPQGALSVHASLQHRPDKGDEFTPKHEPRAAGGARPQPKRRPEGAAGAEAEQPDQPYHRKHAPLPLPPSLSLPGPPGGEKRDKSAPSLKLRLPVPAAEKGAAGKEELKMKIKVSSERHSSSDEGGQKSRHSGSPPARGERHRDRDHAHRHHKHAHPNPNALPHSGNGRAGPDGLAPAGPPLRTPAGVSAEAAGAPSGPSRKRTHADAGHNHHHHHHSKSSKSSKSSAGGLRPSQHPRETGPEASGRPGPGRER